jgi:hypothetical protein
MSLLPRPAQPLLPSCAGAFTRPTFKRFLPLRLGAVLTTGRRTLTNLVRAVGGLAPGHPSSSHRVFSRRRWSTWSLGPTLANFLLRRWVTQDSVPLAGADPVDEHRGTKVDGKGRHRDPVRSTKTYTASRGGRKGSSWRSWSASRLPRAPGHCPSWSRCTEARSGIARTPGAPRPPHACSVN